MKLISVLLILLSPLRSHAWFENKEQEQRIQQQEQQIATERASAGAWQVIAGLAVVGAVILFTVGTALGSKIRKHGKTK